MKDRRMTRKKDQNECRIDKCKAEQWMFELYSNNYPDHYICKDCPFKEYIDYLAQLEDSLE